MYKYHVNYNLFWIFLIQMEYRLQSFPHWFLHACKIRPGFVLLMINVSELMNNLIFRIIFIPWIFTL